MGTQIMFNVYLLDRLSGLLNRKGVFLNWDEVAGRWRQFKGNVREKLGKFTDNDLSVLAGKRDQLIGQIQATLGLKPEEAEKGLKDWGG